MAAQAQVLFVFLIDSSLVVLLSVVDERERCSVEGMGLLFVRWGCRYPSRLVLLCKCVEAARMNISFIPGLM